MDWWVVVFACMTLYVPNRSKNRLGHRVAVFKVTFPSKQQGHGFTPLVASICWSNLGM